MRGGGSPHIRPVPVKSEAQQASRALERSRELLIKQRTQLMNSLRAMLAEFGIVAAQGYRGFAALRAHLADEAPGLPETLVAALRLFSPQFDALTPSIGALEEKIRQIAKPIGHAPPQRHSGHGLSSPPMRSWRRSATGGSSPLGATSPLGPA